MSDQDRISPYNINTESSRQVRIIKKKTQLENYKLIQYQILQIEIMSILWQTIGRITNEVLGVKGFILADCHVHILRNVCTLLFGVSISQQCLIFVVILNHFSLLCLIFTLLPPLFYLIVSSVSRIFLFHFLLVCYVIISCTCEKS